jgi:hypothetical protein
MALCPAHADKNPSLSIRQENGRLLLHCFAGCTVEAVCAALGITVRELFSDPPTAHKPQPPIVREAERQIAGLRGRLTPRDRERGVTVVLASETNFDAAIARALALAVEGELGQVLFDGEAG